ncbi:MAG: hypothetical protein ABTQ27_02490 [Amaricoccus sp.]|uniref:hypothetical protein n=1 Tax=Amaricoccus sp. TaxID=1872485 RepID=UPI003315284C
MVYKREASALTLTKLTDVAALPWGEQPERVFDGGSVKTRLKAHRGQRDMSIERRAQFERLRLA